jgi:DNA mismatch repair protein MutS
MGTVATVCPSVVGMANTTTPIIINRVRAGQSEVPGAIASNGARDRMNFDSILFETPEDRAGDDTLDAPAFFADLNCDQVVAAITAGREEYNLKPFFHSCLHRVGAIKYRHEVMQDLENAPLQQRVSAFSQTMREIRDHLLRVRKLYYKEQRQAWFLGAVEIYCRSISSFANDLHSLDLRSRGFLGYRDYLMRYAASSRFRTLVAETANVRAGLATVNYCIQIKGDGFTVRKYQGETDYSAEVEATFEKFKQGAVRDYRVKFGASEEMNHIEAKILEFVAKLYPEEFAALDNFYTRHDDFVDRIVAVFDREVQFYIGYLEHIAILKRASLQFCYPRVSDKTKEVYNHDGFDIALAHKLVGGGSSVVCNDFYLQGNERILVISGPNQGGKTTFARAFGQLHYLASIGCPVPGREAQLFLFNQIFTHFEKQEKVENLRGKLEDDLLRVHEILNQATSRSIVILNEVFTSTTIQDEIFLSTKVMKIIIELGLLCLWVTFVDELASFGPQTVSMVSTVVPENPALRTFKVVRRPADGLAYAMAIAQKYGLTYDAIKERIKS